MVSRAASASSPVEMRRAFYVLCAVLGLYLVPAVGQLFEDPTKTYKNMTFQWDPRHRGGIDLPRCVKRLMNCWEVIKPEMICKNRYYYESLCMVLRNGPCHDLRPFGLSYHYPYYNFDFTSGYCDRNSYT